MGRADHVPHLLRNDRCRARHVGAGDALRERHQVGLHVVEAGSEPSAQTTKAGDHFIGDEQHVMLVENLLDLLEIAFRWADRGGRAHHRLGDERADGLGILALDQLVEVLGQALGIIQLRLAGIGAPVVMRLVRVDHEIQRQAEGLVHDRQARQAGTHDGHAVIAHLAGDDLALLGLATENLVVPGELDVAVIGFGARACE